MTSELVSVLLALLTFGAGGAVAVVAAIEDARTGRLRNTLTTAIAGIAVVGFGAAALVVADGARFFAVVVGSVLFGVPWFVSHLLNPGGIGFGDVKLTAGLGLYLGWIDPLLSPIAIVVAAVLFVASSVVLRRMRLATVTTPAEGSEPDTRPFGPALVLAAGVVAAAGAFVG